MPRSLSWLVIAAGAWLACSSRQDPASATHRPAPANHASPGAAPTGSATAPVDPDAVERVPVAEARARVQAGQALFVCAYEDARCAELGLEGSIPWSALQARLPGLPRDQEIILFCS